MAWLGLAWLGLGLVKLVVIKAKAHVNMKVEVEVKPRGLLQVRQKKSNVLQDLVGVFLF